MQKCLHCNIMHWISCPWVCLTLLPLYLIITITIIIRAINITVIIIGKTINFLSCLLANTKQALFA